MFERRLWLQTLTLEDWLAWGKEKGWVSDPVCATHDGVPSTEEEEEEWDQGYDPCEHVLRLWPEPRPSPAP